ncbi:Hypothetical Protein SLY_0265 [Strawberry lethal yellows phytoplasma (CPA) str. NZSb11]|uniref:Uncharacterized protein n=1 Tax=Strawberry lethal yellows phytoplasma (CPA) str. NZSb11 TaxID=980422 RepID=R4RWE6_PHYAS|nr:Hypothetical Protein SLY_0265 [Strawberry lethal yellows phytoplasma (CPA) str. NZSb11]
MFGFLFEGFLALRIILELFDVFKQTFKILKIL